MWKKVLLGFMAVLSAIAGFGVAKVESTMKHTLNHIQRDTDSVLSKVDLSGIEIESDNDIVNILLIGNDYREEENYDAAGLTDVMMIGTMDKKHNTLKLTTLMRDTLVDVTDKDELRKLNSAYEFGGVQNLYKTIAKNFNIRLDGYVMVGFDAFEKIVNSVGGVEIVLTETEARYMNMTNYIRKHKNRKVVVGKQTLNGDQALAYCRIRKGKDKIGEPVRTVNGLIDDYGRTWRQRTVVSAVFDKMKALPKAQWVDLANVVLPSVETDLDNGHILDYIKDVIMMGTTEVYTLQIPYDGYFREGRQEEFPTSEGDPLVPTNGVDPAFDTSENARILYQFVFQYDGKEEFAYRPPADASAEPSEEE